jgi:hypothetical protein
VSDRHVDHHGSVGVADLKLHVASRVLFNGPVVEPLILDRAMEELPAESEC